MKKSALILSMLATSTIYAWAQVNLTVVVTNIKSSDGDILVTLFDSQETFLEKAYKSLESEAQTGQMKFVFNDVPPGRYTISVVQDKNANGKLDKNMIGIPTEPYGISMEGKNMFGPPTYDKAVFEVKEDNLSLTINL